MLFDSTPSTFFPFAASDPHPQFRMSLSFPAVFVIFIQQCPFHFLPVVFAASSLFLSTFLFRGLVFAVAIIARFVFNEVVQQVWWHPGVFQNVMMNCWRVASTPA